LVVGYGWLIYTVGVTVGCWQWIREEGKREENGEERGSWQEREKKILVEKIERK
jgi:hypothetical protein